MSRAEYDVKVTEPELRFHVVKFVGGTAAVTKVFGNGVDVSYTATGRVTLTWSDTAENPGTFIGIAGFCFQGTTPGDVDLFQLVHEGYNTSTRTLVLNLYESGSLADLAALEWLTVTVAFSETSGLF